MTLQGLSVVSSLDVDPDLKLVLTAMAEHGCVEVGNQEHFSRLAQYCETSIVDVISKMQQAIGLGLLVQDALEGKPVLFVCAEDRDDWHSFSLGQSFTPSHSFSGGKRIQVFSRDNFSCVYCGQSLEVATPTIDHVVPRSRGGGDGIENLVACCSTCNSSKGARTPDEWRGGAS